jgi:hypothetical protein
MSIHTAQYAALEKKDPKLQQIKNWVLKDGDDRWGVFLGGGHGMQRRTRPISLLV